MIDETIGSIGNTQGVSDNRMPARKKTPTTGQNAPLRSTDSIAPESPFAAATAAMPAPAGAAVAGAAPGPATGSPLGTGMTVPAPPNPARLTSAALCIGG